MSCIFIDIKEEKELPDDEGPHRFSKQEILDSFSHDFSIEYIKPSVFHGTLDYPPKAWLVVMTKKS